MQRPFRSRSEAIVAGVAAGLAQSAGLPPTLLRLLFVLLALASGVGIVLYGLGVLLLPREGSRARTYREAIRENAAGLVAEAGEVARDLRAQVAGWRYRRVAGAPRQRRLDALGGAATLLGVTILLATFDLFGWVSTSRFFALLLLGVGLALVLRRR